MHPKWYTSFHGRGLLGFQTMSKLLDTWPCKKKLKKEFILTSKWKKKYSLTRKVDPKTTTKKTQKNIESEQLQNNSGNPKKKQLSSKIQTFCSMTTRHTTDPTARHDYRSSMAPPGGPPVATTSLMMLVLVHLKSPFWTEKTMGIWSKDEAIWRYHGEISWISWKDFMKISKIRMIIQWIPLILDYFGQKLGPWQTPHALDPAEPSACSSRCHSLAWPGGNPDVFLIKISIYGGPKMRLPPNYHPVMTFTVRHGKIHPSFYS